MRKTYVTLLAACLFAATTSQAIDINNIPDADASARVGAYVPFTRYDCNAASDATLGGGASVHSSSGISMTDIAAQASEHAYVRLPQNGSYVEWTVQRTGNAVTLRFTMPDAPSGTNGLSGSLDVYVNGVKTNVYIHGNEKTNVPLSSYSMWQYFDKNIGGSHTDNASDTYIQGATACFAFDQVGFVLPTMLRAGDRIRLQSSGDGGLEYGVDFIEIEKAEKKECPDGYVSAAGTNNLQQFINDHRGQKIYVPEGEWTFGNAQYTHVAELPEGTTVTGAGIFYTNIHFGNAGSGGGGMNIRSNSELSDIHLTSQLNSRMNQGANYKGLQAGPDGFFGHDLWVQHFECGAWFERGNNIRIVNCRLTDNLADGLNFCRSTNNSSVYNCIVRNNGDDGLAMWNVEEEYNNRFCYNTIEFGWRAGGLGIFGGVGQRAYNNLIVHCPYSAGIRVNTDFPGPGFKNSWQNPIRFENNTVICSGANPDIFGGQLPSVDIRNNYGSQAEDHEVKNVTFSNTKISRSHWDDYRNTSSISFTYVAISQSEEPELLPLDPDLVEEDYSFDGNLLLEGLAWQNASGNTTLTEGETVTFKAKVTNTSGTDLPAGTPLSVRFSIDGSSSVSSAISTSGLAAGTSATFSATWTATGGGHTITATLDPSGKLPAETPKTDNERVKRLNVATGERALNETYTAVTGGPDLAPTDVYYNNLTTGVSNGSISVGDHIQFVAHVVNAGDAATGNTKHGVQYQVDGQGYTAAPITWCDNLQTSQASHAFRDYPANGGGSQSGTGNGWNYWVATSGSHTVTAWVNDDGETNETNYSNNTFTLTLPTIPYSLNPMFEETDQPDNLDAPASVSITVSAAEWATLYYGELNLVVPAGVTAHTVNVGSDGKLQWTTTYTAGEVIGSGTGVLLTGAPGTYDFAVTSAAGKSLGGTNLLRGFDSDATTTGPSGCRFYMLSLNAANEAGSVGFYYGAGCPNGEAFTSPAHKAYLAVTQALSQARGYAIGNAEDLTGIAISTRSLNEGATYDLQGRRVKTTNTRGIYIRDGKKAIR